MIIMSLLATFLPNMNQLIVKNCKYFMKNAILLRHGGMCFCGAESGLFASAECGFSKSEKDIYGCNMLTYFMRTRTIVNNNKKIFCITHVIQFVSFMQFFCNINLT